MADGDKKESWRDRNTEEGTKRYVVIKVQIDAFVTKDSRGPMIRMSERRNAVCDG
jgi:hypothetical protein